MRIANYLNQSPAFAINMAYESLVPEINRQLKFESVNLLQGLVLTALFFETKNEVTPSQLAELLRTTRGNISHILSFLESKSWIKRSIDPKDSRRFHLELKPEGKKKALALIKVFDQIQNRFEEKLGVASCQRMVSSILQCQVVLKDRS